jgi:hypothetical protein
MPPKKKKTEAELAEEEALAREKETRARILAAGRKLAASLPPPPPSPESSPETSPETSPESSPTLTPILVPTTTTKRVILPFFSLGYKWDMSSSQSNYAETSSPEETHSPGSEATDTEPTK